jgi:methionyl-tRNA formyltransferase
VEELDSGTAKPQAQEKAAASKAPRLEKEHGLVDWSKPAAAIKNQVRALDPWPRAYTHWSRGAGEPLRLILHRVQAVDLPATAAASGTIVEAGSRLVVAAGQGAVEVVTLQPSGKRAMAAAEFLRGYQPPAGAVLS